MKPPGYVEFPRLFLQTLNNLYDIERKLSLHGDSANIQRNVERLKDAFTAEHFFYEDPMGQAFNETRADLDVSIAGESTENLVVTEVIKPVVRYGDQAYSTVIQKGVVVVRSKDEEAGSNNKEEQAQ